MTHILLVFTVCTEIDASQQQYHQSLLRDQSSWLNKLLLMWIIYTLLSESLLSAHLSGVDFIASARDDRLIPSDFMNI